MLPSGTISSARTQVNRPAPSVCEWARWCGSTVSPDELDVTINIDSRELKTLGNCKPRGACAIAREHHIFKEKIMSTPPFAPPAGSEVATPATSNRVPRCFALRTAVCASDGFIPAPPQIDNGDEARYADKCGTYAKCILQGTMGRVDVAAYRSFKKALNSGKPADFANIVLGGPRTLNGPQGGVAFDLEGLDSAQFAVPPAPTLASELYATELVELYWASLLRDIAFADYASNPVSIQAAAELSSLPAYRGPKVGGLVTPNVLFRGGFPGETIGPYLSQFLLQ